MFRRPSIYYYAPNWNTWLPVAVVAVVVVATIVIAKRKKKVTKKFSAGDAEKKVIAYLKNHPELTNDQLNYLMEKYNLDADHLGAIIVDFKKKQ